jgi:hypothetical protein
MSCACAQKAGIKNRYKRTTRCIKNENKEKWEVIIKITETAREESGVQK